MALEDKLNIIKVAFPQLNLERQVEIYNFLKEQDWSAIDEITNAIMVIGVIIDKYPSIKFMFEEDIKVKPWRVSVQCTREQIQDLAAIAGINVTTQYISSLINSMTEEILSQLKEQNTYLLTTNKKFLHSINIQPDRVDGRIIFTLNASFKVLTIKDLRRLKIEKINEKIV